MGQNSRRHILTGLGAAMAAATMPNLARAIPLGPGGRTLAFDNLHTGERASIEYWSNGNYVTDALQRVNYILRDFRNGEVHPIDPRLLDLLNHLHGTLDSSAAFEVISGYRSPATNAMLRESSHGVASKSLHMQGQAIDIRLADRTLADVHAAAVNLRLGGVGFYPGPDFVHVDVGRVRYW